LPLYSLRRKGGSLRPERFVRGKGILSLEGKGRTGTFFFPSQSNWKSEEKGLILSLREEKKKGLLSRDAAVARA